MPDQNRSSYGKTALIDDVTASTTGYSRRQVGEILDALVTTIKQKVASGQRVTLTGFGTWQQSQRAARTGVNIRTREKIQIPAQTGVRFTPGSEFKSAVSGRTTNRSRGSSGAAGASYATERSKAGLGQTKDQRLKGRTVGNR
jgi:DNA-binding protein HU-beta